MLTSSWFILNQEITVLYGKSPLRGRNKTDKPVFVYEKTVLIKRQDKLLCRRRGEGVTELMVNMVILDQIQQEKTKQDEKMLLFI